MPRYGFRPTCVEHWRFSCTNIRLADVCTHPYNTRNLCHDSVWCRGRWVIRSDVDRPDPDRGVAWRMYLCDSCGVRTRTRNKERESGAWQHREIGIGISKGEGECPGSCVPGAEQAKSEYCVWRCAGFFAFDRKGRMHLIHGCGGW